MVFQIRYYRDVNKRPVVLFDIEVYKDGDNLELHSHTCVDGIVNYVFDYLMDEDEEAKHNFLEQSSQIEELRGWLWEIYKPANKNKTVDEQYKDVLDQLRDTLKTFCDDMPGDLFVNED